MINQQLVDYVKQQMQAGIAKDAVRKALSDAGWPPADVDDSLKAAEPVGSVQPSGAMAGMSAAQTTVNPVVAMGGVESVIKASSPTSSSDKFFSNPASSKVSSDYDDDGEDHPQAKKFVISMAVMGAVILVLAGALAFVYFNLNGQLEAAQSGGSGNTIQVADLQQQVAQLTAANGDLTSRSQALDADNQDLASELGFFVPATSTTSVSSTVKGVLSGNASTTFALMTPHNIKIIVLNSKDAKVSAALAPLSGATTTVILAGTHLAGSTNLTVTSVNGVAL
jgi:cell division protein FtsB